MFLRAFSAALPLFALLAAPSAQALTLAQREMTCPLDGQKFMATVINSYTQFGMRLDLRPHGALMAPAPIPLCPGSQFPVFKSDFTAAEIETLKALVASPEYAALRAANTDHFLWAWFELRLGGKDDRRLANIYLRVSWEAEAGDAQRLARYRALARDRFDAAAKAEPAGTERALTQALLAAEMDRLLGRFAEAQARLDALKGAVMPEKPPLGEVAAQIAKWVAAKDSQPRNFERGK